jgi:hypothetical protein
MSAKRLDEITEGPEMLEILFAFQKDETDDVLVDGEAEAIWKASSPEMKQEIIREFNRFVSLTGQLREALRDETVSRNTGANLPWY